MTCYAKNVLLPTAIETRTDAQRILRTQQDVNIWIAEFGNQLVAYDATYKVYRVGAFKNDIQEYTNMKSRFIATPKPYLFLFY